MADQGFVVGRFAVALSKNPAAGGEPRLYALNGHVELKPIEVGPLYDDGDPATVSQEPVTLRLDDSGYILSNAEGLPNARGQYVAVGHYWVYVHAQYKDAVRPFSIEVTEDHTPSNPLDLTLKQPYRPMIGNALIEDRIRAELAANTSLEERQYIRDLFLGGSPTISDAAVGAMVESPDSLTDKALKKIYVQRDSNGLVLPSQLPLVTANTRGAMRHTDKQRLDQAIIASDLSQGIKSAALRGHGEMTGEDGRTYAMIGGCIRPSVSGGDWVLHINSTHPTIGISGITTTSEGIVLHYPGQGHTGVVSMMAVADETLGKHGVTLGCSVTTTQSTIQLGGRVGYAGQIRWVEGTGLTVVNNSSHSAPDTVSVRWDTDTAIISHPRIPVADNVVSPKLAGRTEHLHQVSTRVPFGASSFGIQRRDLSNGSLSTSQSDYWAMFESYSHGRLNPRLFEGNHWTWGNIWYFGVFQTSPSAG